MRKRTEVSKRNIIKCLLYRYGNETSNSRSCSQDSKKCIKENHFIICLMLLRNFYFEKVLFCITKSIVETMQLRSLYHIQDICYAIEILSHTIFCASISVSFSFIQTCLLVASELRCYTELP